jgi:hypothetical protein
VGAVDLNEVMATRFTTTLLCAALFTVTTPVAAQESEPAPPPAEPAPEAEPVDAGAPVAPTETPEATPPAEPEVAPEQAQPQYPRVIRRRGPPPGYGEPGYNPSYDPGAEQGYGPPPGYGPPGYGPYNYGNLPPPPTAPVFERNSVGMMVSGIVVTSLGGIALIAASVTLREADEEGRTVCSEFECEVDPDPDLQGAGIGLAIGGLVGLAVGIPLIIVGAKKVPVGPGYDEGEEEEDYGVRLDLSPARSGVTVTF